MRFSFPLALVTCLAATAQPRVVAVNVDSVIHPITVEIIGHAIEQAQRERAEVVLLRLNTPGGLLEATNSAVQRLLASPVPVVTLVRPSGGRAASAGFFLLLAGDIAAMTEGTHTGAASPVLLGQEMDQVMRKKVESDAAAMIRSLAERRGRNAEAAQQAIHEARSFTHSEALKLRLVDLSVRSESDLLAQLHGRVVTRPGAANVTLNTANAQITPYEMTLRERAIYTIADPNLSFLMLIIGALLLYVEFSNPGLLVPGVSGALMLLLGMLSLSVLPINAAGVALMVLAVALFVLEAKIASHGILGVGGAIAMVLGALILVDGPPELQIRLPTALAVAIPFAAIVVFLTTMVIRAQGQPVSTGGEGMLLETGVARTDIGAGGTVQIRGELWNAKATAPIARGTTVRVRAIDGLCLEVEPVGKDSSDA